ncbi:hypothetical protein Tco_1189393, partial [Tanacetum coccineum]
MSNRVEYLNSACSIYEFVPGVKDISQIVKATGSDKSFRSERIMVAYLRGYLAKLQTAHIHHRFITNKKRMPMRQQAYTKKDEKWNRTLRKPICTKSKSTTFFSISCPDLI